jgi:hypothetical protein
LVCARAIVEIGDQNRGAERDPGDQPSARCDDPPDVARAAHPCDPLIAPRLDLPIAAPMLDRKWRIARSL